MYGQLIKLNIEEYFGKDKIEIESFNVIDVSKKLNIPKESARRKIIELEKSKIILRLKKKLIIDRSAFQYQRPIKSIVKISSFLSNFSEILFKEKILKKKIKYFFLNNKSQITVVFFHGFMSDMHGAKPSAIQKYCRKKKINFLKFFYGRLIKIRFTPLG